MSTRTLVVWCPDWPLVAAGILPEVPAATFHANRVVACTAAARAAGVTRGLRRREAQARCPELLLARHDPTRDARVFEPVVAAVETLTTRVEISRPGACAFATRGPSRYFGGDETLAGTVRAAVDAVLTGLPGHAAPAGADPRPHPDTRARVGIADSPFAAALAARRDRVVPPDATAAFLAPLPVSLLDDPDLVGLLTRLGIRTLGAFAALPADDVTARFGPAGATAHRRARGSDDRPLDCREPPADLTAYVVLDPPADRVDTAAFAAKSMADEVCGSLAAGGMVCTGVRIEAETEHGEHLSRVWRHHRAFTPVTVAERVRWQLEGWLSQHTACGCRDPGCPGGAACPDPVGGTTGGLCLLRIVPEDVQPDDGRQAGFWGGATEADDRAARGLARIQGLLGPESVATAVLDGGRGPAERVRLIPWGEPRERRRAGVARAAAAPDADRTTPPPPAGTATPPRRRRAGKPGTRVRTSGRAPSPAEQPAWPGRVPSPAPTLVAQPPLPADVIGDGDARVSVSSRSHLTHAPTRLSIAGGPWTGITGWAGPWTADERWWDPATHRRRARLQVVTGDGCGYLLTLEAGRWWVEAVYD